MMKKIALIMLLIGSFVAPAQNKRIDLSIQALSNKDFMIDHGHKASFAVKSKAAQKLIRIGKPANQKLIQALNDPTKNVIAHYVLCQINFKQVSFAGPKTMYKDGAQVNMYYLGEEKGEGMVIYENKVGNDYNMYFDGSQIEKIIAYWQKKASVK